MPGTVGQEGRTARLPIALRAVFHSQMLSAAALLFQIYYVLACSDLFVYSPPSPANFPAWIAVIHESPPFLSLTRARSHCRREEARTLFPLFKVSRSVPGPGASSVLLPTPLVSCSMFAPSPTLSRLRGPCSARCSPRVGEGSTWSSFAWVFLAGCCPLSGLQG